MSTLETLATPGWRLDRRRMWWLAACLLLVLAPHMLRLPAWTSALFLLLCGWRLWRAHRGRLAPPGRWTVIFIALATLPGVYSSYGTLTGRQAGVALLTLLAATKLLEARGRRDAYVLCYLGFFLIITSFLFAETMLMALYMLGVMVALTATLAVLTRDGRARTWWHELREAAVLVAQALPLAVLLFAVFPRIPGPLWGLPADAHSGVTGLSENMKLGNITQLSQSDAIAFRVRFDATMPPREQLYWRGPVLTRTDGRSWSQSVERLLAAVPPFSRSGLAYDYDVILEPSSNRILLALDLPARVPRGGAITETFSLRTPAHRAGRMRYRMRSYPEYRLQASVLEQAIAVALPPGAHPRARALALSLRRGLESPEALVNKVLSYFRDQPFRYTLRPPPLPQDPVDGFLFDTRAGFCEHYAVAFTVLMRMAGVPARVVTGYQGGEVNPVGNYMVVRQRDAHAWAEVWLQARGWVRVDPTATVAPSRIEAGVDAALPPLAGDAGLSVLGLSPNGQAATALRRVRDIFDAVQAGWKFWVVGYGSERQRSLLSRMGLDVDTGELAILSVATVTVFMLALAVWLLRPPRASDPVQRQYLAFCAKLARKGLVRQQHEGPVDFGRRVAEARPDLARRCAEIIERYVQLRYAGASGDLEGLRTRVDRFIV